MLPNKMTKGIVKGKHMIQEETGSKIWQTADVKITAHQRKIKLQERQWSQITGMKTRLSSESLKIKLRAVFSLANKKNETLGAKLYKKVGVEIGDKVKYGVF